MSETEQDDAKRRQRARFTDALTTSVQQPGERSRLGARVAGSVAVLALVAGGTIGLSAWRSYQADEDAKKEKLAAQQAAHRKKLTERPSASASPEPSKSTKPADREPEPDRHTSSKPSVRSEAEQEKKAEKDVKSRSSPNRSRVLLQNAESGLCADLPYYDGPGETGTPVNQFRCDGTDRDNQLWDVRVKHAGKGPGGADLVLIRNVKDGYCLELPDRGPKPAGTRAQEAHCNPALDDNELWWLQPAPGRTLLVHNHASKNLCLRVRGPELKKLDQPLEIGDCGQDVSRWRFTG